MAKREELDLCFSYASEDACFVAQVQECMDNMEITTFNYKVRSVPLGENLEDTLKEIYQKRGAFCIVFFSKKYHEKTWTQKELAYIKGKLRKKHGRVIAVLLEEGTLPEEFKPYVYFDARMNRNAQVLAQKLAGRLIDYLRQGRIINRWLVAAASIVLVALLAALGYDKIPSNTTIAMEPPAETMLRIKAKNSGWRSSEIDGATLRFQGLPIDAAPLAVVKGSRSVPGFKNNMEIGLSVELKEFEWPCIDGQQLKKAAIDDKFLSGKNATLEISIREAGLTGEKTETWSRSFPAREIKDFIRHWTTDRSPPCDDDLPLTDDEQQL